MSLKSFLIRSAHQGMESCSIPLVCSFINKELLKASEVPDSALVLGVKDGSHSLCLRASEDWGARLVSGNEGQHKKE